MYDIPRLKAGIIAMWRCGGLDTLVKVTPLGTIPDQARAIGYCTTLKYLAGRTPEEMEMNVGFAVGTKLLRGAEIYMVDPLPKAEDFEFRGYSQCPGGISTDSKDYVSNPMYPPGLGVPQWELTRHSQRWLKHIATVPSGVMFSCNASGLPLPLSMS